MNELITYEETVELLKKYKRYQYSSTEQPGWYMSDPLQVTLNFHSVSTHDYYPRYISFKGDATSFTLSAIKQIHRDGNKLTFVCDAIFRKSPFEIVLKCS